MGLTDPAWVWIATALAVAVFVLLVIDRPRWRLRWLRPVTRGVQGVLLGVLSVLICLLLLNDRYIFYASWADAFGGHGRHRVIHRGASPSAAPAPTRRPSVFTTPVPGDYRLPGRGRRQTYQVRDAASGTTMHVLVELPRGYDPAASRRYPVIIGLHGYPSTPQSFAKLNVLSTVDSLDRSGRLQPTIVVIPQINSPRQLDTECINGAAGQPQTDTWLSRELPSWVIRHLRVRRDRASWAAVGFSFGGWCAAELAMRHPTVFGAAVIFDGYFRPKFEGYHPHSPDPHRSYDLIALARKSPPAVSLWVFASKQDRVAYPTTKKFLAAVRAPTSVTATIVPTGGHRPDVFEPFTSAALSWLAHTLPGFR